MIDVLCLYVFISSFDLSFATRTCQINSTIICWCSSPDVTFQPNPQEVRRPRPQTLPVCQLHAVLVWKEKLGSGLIGCLNSSGSGSRPGVACVTVYRVPGRLVWFAQGTVSTTRPAIRRHTAIRRHAAAVDLLLPCPPPTRLLLPLSGNCFCFFNGI